MLSLRAGPYFLRLVLEITPMLLEDLPPGARARLLRLGGERPFRRRLMELGLLPGAMFRVIRRADLGGVLELEVRSCRLTLRLEEAGRLAVEVLPGGDSLG